MAVETIIKEYTHKTKGKVKTEYRIDADFIPEKAEQICEEFIINYCEANNHEEWLYNEYTEIIEKKNGKVGKRTFLEVRKDFIKKFFSNLTKEKKLSAKDKFINKFKENK